MLLNQLKKTWKRKTSGERVLRRSKGKQTISTQLPTNKVCRGTIRQYKGEGLQGNFVSPTPPPPPAQQVVFIVYFIPQENLFKKMNAFEMNTPVYYPCAQ